MFETLQQNNVRLSNLVYEGSGVNYERDIYAHY